MHVVMTAGIPPTEGPLTSHPRPSRRRVALAHSSEPRSHRAPSRGQAAPLGTVRRVPPKTDPGTDAWRLPWDVVTCLAPLCGDCNGDGNVNILDALAAAQHTVATITLTGRGYDACNVDSDGDVDILDALRIAQSSVGLPVALICC